VESILSAVTDTLKNGDEVPIPDFGKSRSPTARMTGTSRNLVAFAASAARGTTSATHLLEDSPAPSPFGSWFCDGPAS